MAKAVKWTTSTVQYWLNRWKQLKNLNHSNQTGRVRATALKQDQQIISLAEQQTFVTSRDATNQLNRKRVKINERTLQRRLNEAGTKHNRPLSKSLLTRSHRMSRLKWAQYHRTVD